jgi:Na+/H+-translocating membrane pyrophosphatase
MAEVINSTSEIGLFIGEVTNVTGSLWLSLLLFLIGVVVVATAFRLPFEITAMILIPFILVGVLITTSFLGVLAVIVTLLALYIARNF